MSLEFTEISNLSAGPQQTGIGTTYVKITQFDTVGISKGITANGAEQNVTLTKDGFYLVSCTLSFNGTNNTTYQVAFHKNDTEQTNLSGISKLNSTGDVQTISIVGVLISDVNDVVDVRVKTDGTNKNFTVQISNMTIIRIR